MLTVDTRTGSKELAPTLTQMGLPVELRELRFGDFAFTGCGAAGKVRIGVERKTVTEMLQAITDTRFTGHQLPGLLARYDYTWLVVEGYTSVDAATGILMMGKTAAGFGRQRFMASTFEKFLLTLAIKAGLRIHRTRTATDTAWWLFSLYDWWQKPFDQHRSAYSVEEAKPDAVLLQTRTKKRSIIAQLPSVGWTRSPALCQAMTIRQLATSDVATLAALQYRDKHGKFRKLGPQIAKAIVAVCSEEG